MKSSDLKKGMYLYLKTSYHEQFIIEVDNITIGRTVMSGCPYICPERREYSSSGSFGVEGMDTKRNHEEWRLATEEEIKWLKYCKDKLEYIPLRDIKPLNYEIF